MASTALTQNLSPTDYGRVLSEYLHNHSEQALYEASLLSQSCIVAGLGPEDIIALHFDAVDLAVSQYAYRDRLQAASDSQQFLLEVMIAYGVRFKEYLELKLEESQRDAEARTTREHERVMELERLEREKNEILAVIAHELRTPLTVVKGTLDLVARSLSSGRAIPDQAMIESARQALERLSRLTADLVEASRDEFPPMEMTPLDLRGIVEQACKWAQSAAAAKGVHLSLDSGVDQINVCGNADGLLSLCGNLLSNAVRYTPAGGQVTVSLGADVDEVIVEVADTGIGISPEAQARIFERFYRSPEARLLEIRGLGLGLALVQQLAAAHGGRIEVQSTLDQGSTFRIRLPRADAAAYEEV